MGWSNRDFTHIGPSTGGGGSTVTAGSTTTGLAGSSASVTNVGSTTNAIFDFTIPRGSTGATGATGSTGAAGTDGKTILYGTGAPGGGVGVNGDFYIATDTNFIYGPKASGSWPSGTSLVGPQGDPASTDWV